MFQNYFVDFVDHRIDLQDIPSSLSSICHSPQNLYSIEIRRHCLGGISVSSSLVGPFRPKYCHYFNSCLLCKASPPSFILFLWNPLLSSSFQMVSKTEFPELTFFRPPLLYSNTSITFLTPR